MNSRSLVINHSPKPARFLQHNKTLIKNYIKSQIIISVLQLKIKLSKLNLYDVSH